VRKVVLDSADVKQGIHVVEPAPSSCLLELNWVRGLVLGQPEPVHGVVSAEFPPQPWVVSTLKCTTYQLNHQFHSLSNTLNLNILRSQPHHLV
jgi:hypothetical protein